LIQISCGPLIDRPHFLFVCSRNRWRSPTAERLYAEDPRISVRSAGLSAKSPRQLTEADLRWADRVLVMEQGHGARILAWYRDLPELPAIEVLEIPDEYEFMDDELVATLRPQIEYFIDRACAS